MSLLVSLGGLLSCKNPYVRAIRNYPPRDTDYQKFKVKKVEDGGKIFQFERQVDPDIGLTPFTYDKDTYTLDAFLKKTKTQAFLLIENDSIKYEYYGYDYNRSNYISIWSVTKVFVSTLTHIAIKEGYLKSLEDPIVLHIPELKDKVFDHVKIEHLLMMKSGINFTGKDFEAGPYLHVHYDDDLTKYCMEARSVIEPGEKYRYSQIDILLLALILRRNLPVDLTEYLSQKLWKPLGMEFPAYFMVDHTDFGLERVASGLFAIPEDIAKLGRLFLQNGEFNGNQIVDKSWVQSCIEPVGKLSKTYMTYFWRHTLVAKTKSEIRPRYLPESEILGREPDTYANGANNNKFMYLLPKENIIVLRFGKGLTDKKIKDKVAVFLKSYLQDN